MLSGVTVTFPCLQPGATQVVVNLTSSGFIGGTLYTENYVFEVYRNCTPKLSKSFVKGGAETNIVTIRISELLSESVNSIW